MKTALISTLAIIAIAAALIGGARHSDVYADSPTSSGDARALQSPDTASQALRYYTLQLLHILSNPDANQWERYRQAMPHCASAPAYLAEIAPDAHADPLDAILAALTKDLCADLDQRLDAARTVGLLLNEPESMNGYVLITGRFNNGVHLIDHLGGIVHSWQLGNLISHAMLLENGNLLIQLDSDYKGRTIAEVDPNSNIVWQYSPSGRLHHDFLKMPNGNVLMLARSNKTREEAIGAGLSAGIAHPGGVAYDHLIEMRPIGNEGGDIVWEWSVWDYIVQDRDPTKLNYGDISEHPELIDINFLQVTPSNFRQSDAWVWLHVNAIDYNPDLNQIMLSPRQHSELWIIDRSASTEEAPTRSGGNAGKGGALLYRWGNPRAYGHGTAADQTLFRQHHTQWIDPGLPGAGNILVFNNGYELETGEDPRFYSSIEEIVPPVDGYGYRREPGASYLPVEPIWTYAAKPPADFYSRIMGCAQRLPNGNALICDSVSGSLFQVTSDGRTVWRYVYPMDSGTPLKQGEEPSLLRQLPGGGDNLFNNTVYRAYWYAPDHPGLQKYDLTPGDTIEIYE